MNNDKSANNLKFLALGLFDIGIILGYFKLLAIYNFINPFKSILILIIFLTSLAVFNGVIVSSNKLIRKLGTPYFIITIFLTVIYCIVSNILVLMVSFVSVVTILIWQIILLAFFIAIFSIIFYISSKTDS